MPGLSKNLALFALSLTGAFHLGRKLSRQSLIILTYHRVLPDLYCGQQHRPANSLFTSEFEKQVAYLARRYHLVTGEEVKGFLLEGKRLSPHSVWITFDDGYENNYTEALPVLQRHNATAAFFITSNFVGKPGALLWFDRLTSILSRLSLDEVIRWFKQRDASLAMQNETQLRQWLKRLSQDRRDLMITELERIAECRGPLSADSAVTGPMSWEQVRELVACGMTIGSHTVNHQILSSASSAEVWNELEISRQRIEQETGRPCWCFCYPNGESSDFRTSDKIAVYAAGYRCAVTQIPGFANPGVDHYALPRMPVPDSGNMRVFLSQLTGVNYALRSVVSRLG